MSKSNHTAQVPACITSDYLEKMLRNFFKDNSIEIKSYEVTPGSSVGENYIGQILRIELEYTRKNESEKRSIIGKAIPPTELCKEMKKNYDVVKVEIKMMSETLPLLYKELRAKIETEPFFPYVYQADFKNDIIFMEDLKVDGYVVADRKFSLDLEHSLLVIKTIAKIHASSFLLLQKNPEYKNDYLEFYWKNDEGAFPGKVVDGSYTYFLKFLHMWPISEEDKNIFRSYEGKLSDLMTDSYRKRDSSFNVLIHGDCWTANLMFKYENDQVKSVKFVDYQISNYNSIGLDIIHFLFTSAKEYVKTKHLEDILKAYYDTFISVTGEIEGFTLDTVRKEFVERLSFGFVLSATLRCMMIANDGFDLDAFLAGKECPGNDQMFSNPEYIAEFVKILPIFKNYGVFKLNSYNKDNNIDANHVSTVNKS